MKFKFITKTNDFIKLFEKEEIKAYGHCKTISKNWASTLAGVYIPPTKNIIINLEKTYYTTKNNKDYHFSKNLQTRIIGVITHEYLHHVTLIDKETNEAKDRELPVKKLMEGIGFNYPF